VGCERKHMWSASLDCFRNWSHREKWPKYVVSQNKRSSSHFESVCEPRTFGMRSLTCWSLSLDGQCVSLRLKGKDTLVCQLCSSFRRFVILHATTRQVFVYAPLLGHSWMKVGCRLQFPSTFTPMEIGLVPTPWWRGWVIAPSSLCYALWYKPRPLPDVVVRISTSLLDNFPSNTTGIRCR